MWRDINSLNKSQLLQRIINLLKYGRRYLNIIKDASEIVPTIFCPFCQRIKTIFCSYYAI